MLGIIKENKLSQMNNLVAVGLCLLISSIPSSWAESSEGGKNIEELFYHAMIAQAAYEDFNEGDALPTDLQDFLEENEKGFINTNKRKLFTDQFELLNHTKDDFFTGFSATVFKNKNTQEVIFASRGTNGGLDIVGADIIGIVGSGVPRGQVTDLYNYVQRLKAPEGGNYNYVKKSLFRDYWLEFGQASDGAGHPSWFAAKNVNGAGHSLGGNLTAAFGRLFNNYSKDSYTINAGGTAGRLATVFKGIYPLKLDENSFYQQIGGAASYGGNYNSISDMYAADGFNMTTSDLTFTQQGGGDRIPVNIEFPGNVASHYSEYIVDSLGVAWSFYKLDHNYDLAKHSALMDAANYLESEHLDTLIDGMYHVTNTAYSEELWDGISGIATNAISDGRIEVLAGKSPNQIFDYYNESDATKKSTIHSALKGLPFGFTGSSASYSDIDLDDYSESAARDLAGMLATQLNANTNKETFGKVVGLGHIEYRHVSNIIINQVAGVKEATVRFGAFYEDVMNGSFETDRLYGLKGEDTLSGLGGDDHLEGGSGNDTLKGGEGNDTLIGGKGEDTLEGEEGSDILDGGEGNDTYLFTADSGNDKIYNIEDDKSDDTGIVKYEDQVVDGSGAKRKSANSSSYYNKDKEILYMLVDDTLTIQFEDNGQVKSVVNIPKFTNGNLGITLPTDIDSLDDVTTQTHNASASFEGTCPNTVPEAGQMVWLYSWDKVVTDNSCSRERLDVAQVITNDTAYSGFILASGEDDRIIGNDQKEYLHGGLGADYIKAGAGDDLINGDLTLFGLGLVLHTPLGEIGNDWIEAGIGNDTIYGDTLFTHVPSAGNSAPEYDYGNQAFQDFPAAYDAETQNDTIFGGAGDDQIFGNLGNDYLLGGLGADVIYGGAHADRIEGGDGDDFIYADAEILIWMQQGDTNAYENKTYFDELKDAGGDDTVFGGAGNDYISSGTGDDTIYGGEGDDHIYADGSVNEVEEKIDAEEEAQYNGKDLVYGGDGVDNIWGFGNDDILHGDMGNDLIWGDHEDLADSNHGDDIIYGGAGDDQLVGHAGNDKLYGDDGVDLISGGKGNDHLEGGKGDDELQGKEGNDYLIGGKDIDTLFGDEGDDFLDGGAGEDELIGGEGNDILVGGSELDYLWGGAGNDQLAGGSGDDVIQGDEGDDTIAGGRGSDTLRGGAGNDSYIANTGDGESKIDDGSGSNQIVFGAGVTFGSVNTVINDSGVFLDYGIGDSVFIQSTSMGGAWTVSFSDGTSVSLSYLIKDHTPPSTTVTQVAVAPGITAEDLSYLRSNNSLLINYALSSGGSGSSLTSSSSSGLSSKLSANLKQMSMPQEIKGSGQNIGITRQSTKENQQKEKSLKTGDLLQAAEPNSTVTSWIDPVALSDAGYIFSMQDVVIDGVEYQQLSLTNWFNADPASYLNSLTLENGTIDLTQLGDVASTFSGTDFSDVITASDGNDAVLALSGADEIDAKAGNDLITAGAGNDQIVGGSGNDTYYFGAADGSDVILDESGNDKVVFAEGILSTNLSVEEKRNGLLIAIDTLDIDGNDIKDHIFILGWFQEPNLKIESFEFFDGSVLSGDDIEQMITGNRSPVANMLLDEQTADLGRPFSYTLPTNLFSDPDLGDVLEVMAFASEGGLLTDWLGFDPSTQTFTGTPGIDDTATISIFVVAADLQGHTKVVPLNVVVNSENGLPGTVGNDTLTGGENDDFLSGLEGDDTLLGMSGDDRLIGGTGNDILKGGYGNDEFVFSLGDGVDTISTPYNDTFQFTDTDIIEFGEGILPENVQLIRDPTLATNLLVNYGNQGDQIIVENFFTPAELKHPIDQIVFSNGVIWDSEAMRQLVEHVIDAANNSIYVVKDQDIVYGMDGDDYLAGGTGNDELYGEQGDDYLYGKLGDDLLNGGAGNDYFSGDGGSNRLLFSRGHDRDEISLTDIGATDVIVLDESILATDLKYYRFGDDFVIGTSGWFDKLADFEMPASVDDFIIAERFYGRYGHSTEINNRLTVELSDLTSVDLTSVNLNGAYLDLKNQTSIDDYLTSWVTEYGHIRESIRTDFEYEFEGTNDNDIILGSSDNDEISPSGGIDLVYAGAGNDYINTNGGTNYIFAESGNDEISDWFGLGLSHINGGTGDDIFRVEANSYLYFAEGDGHDLVDGYQYNSENLLFIFDGNLVESSFIFSIDVDDLILSWGGLGDQITFENWLDITDTTFELSKAMEIRFADIVWSQLDVKTRILDTNNFAPIANDDSGFITDENVTLNILAADLIANDTDLNDDLLTISSVLGVQGGVVSLENDLITFVPDADYNGSASFSYNLSDGEFESQANVTITINSVTGGEPGTGTEPNPADYDYVIEGSEAGEQLYYSHQNDYISGLGGDDQLFGLGGNDYLNGGTGNDYLDGGAGDDIQVGGDGDDQLGGDAGNDTLIGGSGNDIYVFRPGNGQDIIDNYVGVDGVDYLIFTDDITSDRLIYTRIGDDLVITIKDSTDQVTILNWFLGDEYKIDYIQPSGSSGIPASEIDLMLTEPSDPPPGGGNEEPVPEGWVEPDPNDYENQIAGTENAEQVYFGHGNDYLEGLGGDDQIFGLGGNDYLSGGLGDDYLDGGDGDDIQFAGDGNDQLGGDAGDDLLLGGSGDDIYVYGVADGNDVIDNSIGNDGTDWLILTDDLTIERLIFSQLGNDLIITVTDSVDQVIISNWFLGSLYQVDYIQPSGGTGIPASEISTMIN